MFFNAPVLIQPEEVAGGALSDDDDFQDESMFTYRKPAAASEPVHWEKPKVCGNRCLKNPWSDTE